MKTKKDKAQKILQRIENTPAGELGSGDANALLLSQISEQLDEIIQRLNEVKTEQLKPAESIEMTGKTEDKETKKWYDIF